VGSKDGNVYAINPGGSEIWRFESGTVTWSSFAIGSDGTIYIGSDSNSLYALESSSSGLADTSWPMFHRDSSHTGSISLESVRELLAYYPFNGNANDESGNGNHGTIHGPVLTEDRFGNPNSAFSFDGVDDYIDLGNDASLSPAASISLEAISKKIILIQGCVVEL
jgi:hypothetical protein